ncbi:MAG: DedA family protein, partial [Cutibacterium acnes]|nr:DedA family protein [Cutibacterium acnes]
MNFTHWVDAINEYVAANASHPIVTVVMWALSVIDGIFPVVPSESVVVALAAIGQPPWWILI